MCISKNTTEESQQVIQESHPEKNIYIYTLDSGEVWLCHMLVFNFEQVSLREPSSYCLKMKIEDEYLLYLPHKVVKLRSNENNSLEAL